MTKSKSILPFSRFLVAIVVSGCFADRTLGQWAVSAPAPDEAITTTSKSVTWAVNCNEVVDAPCHRQRQIFREGVEALQRAVTSYKERTRERARLQRALHQILSQDRRQPAIAFGFLVGSDATTSPDGKTLTFNVDSNAMNDARVAAGTIAEEGTHSADAQDPRRATLSPFSFEYRGKQANAWAAQAAFGASNGLAKITRAGTEVVIWDPRTGHRATDKELKRQVLDGYNN